MQQVSGFSKLLIILNYFSQVIYKVLAQAMPCNWAALAHVNLKIVKYCMLGV